MVKALALALAFALAGAAQAAQFAPIPEALPSAPASSVLLSRALQAQIPNLQIAQSLATASSLAQSVQAFEAMGLLKAGEVDIADAGQAMAMRHVLQAVWRETSPSLMKPEVDGSWAVPAVVVRAPEATYYLHGVSHGFTGGLGGKKVRALERQVAAQGRTLLVEQTLPAAFRLRSATEVVDHPENRAAPSVARWLTRLMPLGRRFHRFYFSMLARVAAHQGNADLSAHLWAVADRLYGHEVDPVALTGLDLPLALKEDVEPWIVGRSRALAAAASAAAQNAGGVVHVLSGWSHVPDLAALLGPKSGT